MTDTDSLCYHIKLPPSIVYPKLKKLDWMDLSNYKKSPRYSTYWTNEKYLIPGYFKDETAGIHIVEFAGR